MCWTDCGLPGGYLQNLIRIGKSTIVFTQSEARRSVAEALVQLRNWVPQTLGVRRGEGGGQKSSYYDRNTALDTAVGRVDLGGVTDTWRGGDNSGLLGETDLM